MSERAYWGSELFDLFAAPGVTLEEIAHMRLSVVRQHIRELRADNPDDIPLTDREIADELWMYATTTVRPGDWHPMSAERDAGPTSR
jgi:hypothetical protein